MSLQFLCYTLGPRRNILIIFWQGAPSAKAGVENLFHLTDLLLQLYQALYKSRIHLRLPSMGSTFSALHDSLHTAAH